MLTNSTLHLKGSISARTMIVQEKADASIPITSLSPPEGNTTYLPGTNWCVARPGVPQADLKIALDWACGLGKADCRAIQAGGPCFVPDTLLSHASYAFNNYYQQNGNNDIACHFGGTAVLTHHNPSECFFIILALNYFSVGLSLHRKLIDSFCLIILLIDVETYKLYFD